MKLLLLSSILALCACRSVPEGDPHGDGDGAPRSRIEAPVFELPAEWASASAFGFERLALAWPPEGVAGRLDGGELAELRAALARQDQISVRAAVLLARSGDPRAEAALFERLEERAPAVERHADAADVVAAAALRGARFAPDAGERLAALAVGANPHPDLEVRVECAASALHAGHDEVIPFLLRVLRARTPDEALDPPDWPPTQTVAWAKTRAAEVLSRRAGRELRFRPDGSYEHQMREADRLADALARRPTPIE